MSEADEFWYSDIPFISSADGKRIDWTDAGLTALATLATSFFSSLADTVSTLWQQLIITPVSNATDQYSALVSASTDGIAGLFQFDAAIAFADQTGFIGALVLIAAGGFIVSVAIGRIQ